MPSVAAGAAVPTLGDARTAADPSTADRIARTYGHDVVDESKTTATQQVFAQADGNSRLESSSDPVRVRRADGWAAVDLNLVRSADGGWVPAASPTSVRFSGGGTDALGALLGPDGTWSTQSWTAGALGAPAISGDTATYPNVYPGVDLKMTATVSGFSQVLVVKTPVAAANPALKSIQLGLGAPSARRSTAAAGGMDLSSGAGSGSGVHVGTATWWDSTAPDSSYDGPGGSGLERAVPASLSATQIRLDATTIVQRTGLKYPLYVDPSYSWTGGINGGTAYTFVDRTYPTAGYWNGSHPDHYQHVGYISASWGGPDTTRSFWRMNTNAVAGKHILSAEFNTFEVWASSCKISQVDLYSTGAISTGTTWNTQPAWSTNLSSANVAYGWSPGGIGGTSSCSTGGHAVGFAATSAVATAARAKSSYVTLGLKAANEIDPLSWKKFRAAATLVITYNSVPNVPTSLRTSSNNPCVIGATRPVIGKLPTLYAVASDPDKGNVAVQFEWWHTGGARVGYATTAYRASGSTTFAATIPTAAFANGQNVSWRARTYDGTDYSGFTGWCELHLDTAAPATPLVASASTQFPDYDYFATQNIDPPTPPKKAGDAGTVILSNGGSSDVTTYYVSINGRPIVAYKPATAGGSVTLTLTPGLPDSWIDLYSVDAANNKSGTYHYEFPLQPSSVLKAQWNIAGPDQLADGSWHTASSPDIALRPTEDTTITASTDDGRAITDSNTGAELNQDAQGNFRFYTDGINDYAATAGPVVDTSGSYTVVATVKPDDVTRGTFQTAVSQGGVSDSAFYLQFDPAGNMRFAVTNADTPTRAAPFAAASQADMLDATKCGVQLQNTDPTADNFYDPNSWHTLVGVYDKPDNQLQIWVDGCTHPIAQVDGPATVWNATGPILFGTARQNGKPSAGNMYGGGISDVLVYSGAATADQIQTQLQAAHV